MKGVMTNNKRRKESHDLTSNENHYFNEFNNESKTHNYSIHERNNSKKFNKKGTINTGMVQSKSSNNLDAPL